MIIAPVPAAHRAAGQRQMRVQHATLRIEEFLHSEPIAARAGPGWVVEREQLRLERRHAVAAHRAGMPAGKSELSLRRPAVQSCFAGRSRAGSCLPAPRMRGALLRDRPGLAILARRSPLARLTLARFAVEKREPREPAREAPGGLERF